MVSVKLAAVAAMFRVPAAAFSNPPVPVKAVPTVKELLFVSVTPVTVTLGIVNVPVSD